MRSYLVIAVFIMSLLCIDIAAQTTGIRYQGSLTEAATPANGSYEMQFKLFDAPMSGSQIGSTVANVPVQVTNGIFSVTLDFGSAVFGGADRWLEIAVRHNSSESYVTLVPREQLRSSPYSIRTLSAVQADSLSAACIGCVSDVNISSIAGSKVTGTVNNAAQLGGVAANQYVVTTDPRMTNARTPTGTAGGALSGTYPNPTIGTSVITTNNLGVLPHARAIATTAQTFANGAFVKVALDNVPFAANVTLDNAADELVIATAGAYVITGEIVWATNAAGLRFLTLNVNGAEIDADSRPSIPATNSVQNVTAIARLNVGDRISIVSAQTSGGNLLTDPGFGRGASLSVSWVSK